MSPTSEAALNYVELEHDKRKHDGRASDMFKQDPNDPSYVALSAMKAASPSSYLYDPSSMETATSSDPSDPSQPVYSYNKTQAPAKPAQQDQPVYSYSKTSPQQQQAPVAPQAYVNVVPGEFVPAPRSRPSSQASAPEGADRLYVNMKPTADSKATADGKTRHEYVNLPEDEAPVPVPSNPPPPETMYVTMQPTKVDKPASVPLYVVPPAARGTQELQDVKIIKYGDLEEEDSDSYDDMRDEMVHVSYGKGDAAPPKPPLPALGQLPAVTVCVLCASGRPSECLQRSSVAPGTTYVGNVMVHTVSSREVVSFAPPSVLI